MVLKLKSTFSRMTDRVSFSSPRVNSFPEKSLTIELTELAFPFSFIVKMLIDVRFFDFKSS